MLQSNIESPSFGLFGYSERDVAVDQLHAATAIYTRSNVIDPLLQRIGWPNAELSLFDPSCGDGAFLLRALQMVTLPVNDLASLSRIRGWEIHPSAVEEARLNVSAHLVSVGWSQSVAARAAQEVILEEDFLQPSRPMDSFKLVAGNPPYLRFGNLPEYFKAVYGDSLPEHARTDLLHAFLDRCCSMIPADGAVGFVTADRWLFNCGAAALRETIGRHLGVDHISRLDMTSAFYRPKDRRKGALPRIHPVEIILRHKALAARPLSREPIYPDGDLPELETGRTLQDICNISVGPWFGPFGIFVVDELTAKSLPPDYLIPAVDTDDLDFKTGGIKRPTKFVIVTERDTRPVEAISDHILRNISRMPQRGLRSDGRFWIPPERISDHLDKQRLVIPRIARELKTVVVPPGVLAINHNLSICALNGQDLGYVREIITCPRSQEWFRRTADRLENGYFSVKTRTLRRLPI